MTVFLKSTTVTLICRQKIPFLRIYGINVMEIQNMELKKRSSYITLIPRRESMLRIMAASSRIESDEARLEKSERNI